MNDATEIYLAYFVISAFTILSLSSIQQPAQELAPSNPTTVPKPEIGRPHLALVTVSHADGAKANAP